MPVLSTQQVQRAGAGSVGRFNAQVFLASGRTLRGFWSGLDLTRRHMLFERCLMFKREALTPLYDSLSRQSVLASRIRGIP